MWQAPSTLADDQQRFESELKAKGDELQRLNVIETLPQLLAEDAHSCITRVLPKIQQSLPSASTEFHMAAALIFKQILEQRLVSTFTFAEVFLQSIISSLESREPVIAHAWLETILDVIELLPADIVKREILPIATNARQLSQNVNSRITCCRLLGKIATRFDAASVKNDILPTAQSLCQDVNNDVRACICLQLRFIGDHMADDVVKLLPLLVELAGDEESNVRQAAIQTIGHLLPRLKSDSVKDIVVPLIKVASEGAVKAEEDVICVISQEFGKIAQTSKNYLTAADQSWFIEYFIKLALIGTPSATSAAEDKKPDFSFIASLPGSSIQVNDRFVECRRNCAFNLPAMFEFASGLPENVDSLIPTFRNLAGDSYFMVRRTVACGFHEVVKVLGTKSALIKAELIRLLKDGNEEVLQGLIPHVSEVLDVLQQHQVIGADQMDTSSIDLGRALIKCEAEVSSTNNWRLSALMLAQLDVLPKCFSSDFIYTYVVPIVRKRVLYSRPLPVRLAAGKTLLIYLRYNLKSQQRADMRKEICCEFARASSCYMRMVFIRMMIDATTIFSSAYFKEHFCTALLSLMEDPVANVRLKVVTLVPTIKACLRLPADKKLLSTLESSVRNLLGCEKDRDVSAALSESARQMDSIEVRVDGQPSPSKLSRYDSEDMRKYEEEKKIEALSSGSNVGSLLKKPNALKLPPAGRAAALGSGPDSPGRPVALKARTSSTGESPKSSSAPRPSLVRQMSTTSRHVPEVPKASSSDGRPRGSTWERSAASSNPTYMLAGSLAGDYPAHSAHCSCVELAERLFRVQPPSAGRPRSASSSFSGSSSSSRPSERELLQQLALRRSGLAGRARAAPLPGHWSLGSLDDEFMVDAGVRLPWQMAQERERPGSPEERRCRPRQQQPRALDVNHNRGLGKIPVAASRTAPSTRTCSPVRLEADLPAGALARDGFSRERRLRRFRSSEQPVDRLCQRF